MLESLTPTGEVAPYTTTTTQPVDATKYEWTKKQMSPEVRADLRKWLDAQDKQEQAQASPTATAAPSAEDVDAQQVREAAAQANIARADREAQPDPFEGNAPVPTMGGKPMLMPQVQQPAKIDRPYTSTQFDATPQMRGPQTFDQAKDESAGYKAQVEARLAKQRADSLARIEDERQKKIADAMAKSEAAAAEYAKAGSALYEEPSAFRRIGTAIALGLGAYGAGLTGGPNYALQMHEAEQRRDMESKKMRIEVAAKKMAAAGASREQIAEWAKGQETHLLTIQRAQLDALEADVNKRLAAFPQAQTAAAQKFAEMREKNAKERFQAIEAATAQTMGGGGSNEGVKVSIVEGKNGMSGRMLPGAHDIEAAATAEVMEGKAKQLRKLTAEGAAPTPDEIAQVHNNELQFLARQHRESSSTLENLIGQVGRGLDVFPDSIYPKGMKQETREWIRNQRDLWHSEAVALYGLGWLSTPENYAHVAEARAPKIGDTQQDILEKAETTVKQAIIQNRLFHEASKPWRQADAVEMRKEVASNKAKSPSTSSELAAKIGGLSSADKVKAMEAFRVKNSDPRFSDADKWLRNRGLR